MATIPKAHIPVFSLYGEAGRGATPGFVHVEPISMRAQLHDWTIGSHRHSHLAQALLIENGGGQVALDEFTAPFAAPWLIWIPAGTVHSLLFDPFSEGSVVTMSVDFLAGTLTGSPNEARLRAVADRVLHGPLPDFDDIGIDFRQLAATIEMETTGGLACSESAVAAALKLMLIGLMRMTALTGGPDTHASARSAIFRRFKRLVDRTFREQRPITRLAREIGISTDRLHAICHEAAGMSPRALLHERLILEAKRDLRYTALSIADIAFDLGFRDQGYFSRFFAKRVGLSPAAYRRAHAAHESGRAAPP
ncbi:MAG: helix-turn-helix domain-containing protein [Xanthobacteraceae bacterium]|nr:MAG: helix-turn-helix domain-containing protein [Xanthobacteraceae bacterium]